MDPNCNECSTLWHKYAVAIAEYGMAEKELFEASQFENLERVSRLMPIVEFHWQERSEALEAINRHAGDTGH